MAETQKIKLMSSDSAEITVGTSSLFSMCTPERCRRSHFKVPLWALLTTDTDRDVAERSVLIKNMMEDIGEQAMTEAIPIPNASSQALVKPPQETNISL